MDPKHYYVSNGKGITIYYYLERKKYIYVWQINKFHSSCFNLIVLNKEGNIRLRILNEGWPSCKCWRKFWSLFVQDSENSLGGLPILTFTFLLKGSRQKRPSFSLACPIAFLVAQSWNTQVFWKNLIAIYIFINFYDIYKVGW